MQMQREAIRKAGAPESLPSGLEPPHHLPGGSERNGNRRGLSLIELLITLALILVMAMMLAGRTSRSRQERDLHSCSKNLQTIYSALNLYSLEHGSFPASSNALHSEPVLSLLVPQYTTLTEIFICPGSKDRALPQAIPFADRRISYAYYMGWNTNLMPSAPLLSDRQVDSSSKREGEALFSSDGKGAGNNHDKYGGNVMLGSGEVRRAGPRAPVDLLFPTNVVLLNPRS